MSYNKETGMYEGYIYCITNKVNGKQYIGQTIRDIQTRFEEHLYTKNRKDKKHIVLYKAINKYGKVNFSISEVCKYESESLDRMVEEINNYEIKYINIYNSIVPNGYNMTFGGDSSKHRERKVCQYTLMGKLVNTYDSINQASFTTNVERSNITANCAGRLQSAGGYIWSYYGNIPNTYKPAFKAVKQYNLDGILLNTFSSIKEAGITNNICPSLISSVCNGKLNQTHGFLWSYIDCIPTNYINAKVYMYDLNGNYLREFSTASEACNELNIASSNLSACLNNRKKSVKGYLWSRIKLDNIRPYNGWKRIVEKEGDKLAG
jgi:group I intron endonuclease